METDIHTAGSEVDPPCLRQDSRNSSKGHLTPSRPTPVRSTNQDGAFSRSSANSSQKKQFEWGAKFYFARNHFLPSLPAINLLSLSSLTQRKEQPWIEAHKGDAYFASSSVDIDPGLRSLTSASVDESRFVVGRGDDDSKKPSFFPSSESREGLSIKAEIELVEKSAASAAAGSSGADFKFTDSLDPETPAYFCIVEDSPASDEGLRFPCEPESLKDGSDLCPDSDNLEQCAVKAVYVCLTEEALLNHNDAGEDLMSYGDSDFSDYSVIEKWEDGQSGIEQPGLSDVSEQGQPKKDAVQPAKDTLVDSVQDVGTTQSPPFSSVDPSKAEPMNSTCLGDEMQSVSRSVLPPGTFDETFRLENHDPCNARHLSAKWSDPAQFLPGSLHKEGSSCNVDEQANRGRKQQENNSSGHQAQKASMVDALESCYDKGSLVDSNAVILKSQQLSMSKYQQKETLFRDIGSQATPESLRKVTVSKIPKLIQRERNKTLSDGPVDKKSNQTLSPQKPNYDERKTLVISSPTHKASPQIEMTHRVHLASRQLIQGVTRSDPTILAPSGIPDTFIIVRDRRPVRSGRISLNPLRRPTTIKTCRADKSMSVSNNNTDACLQGGPSNNVIRLIPPWNSVAFTPNPYLSSKTKVSFTPDIVSNQQAALPKSKLSSFKVKATQKPVATETTNKAVLLQQRRIHPSVRHLRHAESACEHSESDHQGTDFCNVYASQRRGSRLPKRTLTEYNFSGSTDTAGFAKGRGRKISTQSTSEAKMQYITKKDLPCRHETLHDERNILYPKQGKNFSINSKCNTGVNENSNSIQNPQTEAENEILYQYLLNSQMFSGGLKFPKTFKLEPNKVPLDFCEARQFCKTISRLTTEKSSVSHECPTLAPPYVFKSDPTGSTFKMNFFYKNTEEPSKNIRENECELLSCTPMANQPFQKYQSDHFQVSAGSVAGFNMPQHQVFVHQQKEKED